MADTDFWLEQYERKASWPITWRLVADDLIAAASHLFDAYRRIDPIKTPVGQVVPIELRFLRPILLLRAAAIEALLKGRAVRQGHRFVVEGSFQPISGAGKGHDLVLLADVTKFTLNDAERDLLARLTPHLELGRYPIGRSWQTGLRKHPHPGVGHVIASHYSGADEAIFRRMVKRLRRTVDGTGPIRSVARRRTRG